MVNSQIPLSQRHWMSLPQNIKLRTCIHRGVGGENTARSIAMAVSLNPYYIEFDIIYIHGNFQSGHPPDLVEGDEGKLETILKIFNENGKNGGKTFPKIDLKSRTDKDYDQDCKEITNNLVDVLQRYTDIPFYLINYSIKTSSPAVRMQIELLLAQEIQKKGLKEKIGINIDLRKYKGVPISNHISCLEDTVYSISLEIDEQDWNQIKDCAKENNIKEIHFWLRSPPDNPNPSISYNKLFEALDWGEKNELRIYFDINPDYMIPG